MRLPTAYPLAIRLFLQQPVGRDLDPGLVDPSGESA